MSWAAHYIEKLEQGETVQFRPRGHSMAGRVEDGQLCTVAPARGREINVGAVVLVRVRGRDYLHLVHAVHLQRFQIGNNRGHINGWVSRKSIYGVLLEDS